MEKDESEQIQAWIENGVAFWSDPEGIESLQIAEHSSRSFPVNKASTTDWLAADLYVDCGQHG